MAQKAHTTIARLGNDIGVTWAIFQQVSGVDWRTPLDLEGIPISLKLYNPLIGEKVIEDFAVESNKIHWTFKGKDQTKLGRYTLTLTTNPGLDNMHVVDRIDFLELVARSNVSVLPAGTIHGRNSSMDVDVINITSVVDQMYETVAHAAQAYAALKAMIGEKQDEIPDLEEIREGAAAGATAQQPHPYTSLERLASHLFRISFAALPPEGGADSVPGACTSFVRGGKLFRNLDWNYDDAPSFILRCPGFEGMSILSGITDSNIPDDLAAQLPYHLVDGCNEHGIRVSAHVLYNDWGWHGSGAQNIPLYKLPFLVLTTLTSLDNIEEDLADILGNLVTTPAFDSAEYLLQVLVTDGTNSYVLAPPVTDGAYQIVNISGNPKLTNFRWVPDATVVRTGLQMRPTGVERWNAIGAQTKLQDMRFTLAYESDDRLSEFIGLRGTTKDTTDAELEEIYQAARALYLTRVRDGRTWQTMHSAVYSANGLEELYIQEDWNRNFVSTTPDVSGFVTKSVNDLLNYYLKADTYTKAEVQALVNTVKQFQYEVVSELPTASESTMHKIYLVPSANPKTKNAKDEYITIESSGAYSWEQIGSTAIDLSGYVTTQALNAALSDYVTTAALTLALAGKQDTIADIETIRTQAGQVSGKYTKPSGGIPKTDLASGVQTSLEKADSALQEHQDISGKVDKVPDATEGNIAVLDSDGNVTDGNKKLSDLASIVKGYLYNGVFYEESAHTTEITPAKNNQYLDMTDASEPKAYIWNGSAYIAYAGAEYAVKYTPQTLTEQQQTQARQNIGAAHDESVVAKEGGEMAALAIIINQQNARIEALENALMYGLKKLVVDNLEVRCKFNQFVSEGNSYLRGAGAPSADIEPENWSEDEYGPWTGVPQYIGQRYLNTLTNKWYTAKGNAAVSDWVQDTNA